MLSVIVCVSYYHKVDRVTAFYWWQDHFVLPPNHVKLIGSSTIDRFPLDMLFKCESVHSYGFDNGTIESINRYLYAADLSQASHIIIYIGENDIAMGKSVDQSIEEISVLIDNIKAKSNAKIALMNIKLSPSRASFHVPFVQFNRKIQQLVSTETQVNLMDFSAMLHERSYEHDGIHLNQTAYLKVANWINTFCSSR